MTNLTHTPVWVLRDKLEKILRDGFDHPTVVNPISMAQYIITRLNLQNVEVDWSEDHLKVTVPRPETEAQTQVSDWSYEDLMEALTGPMGRTEKDAATARSYNPKGLKHSALIPPVEGDHRHMHWPYGGILTKEEHDNAFGVTGQRED